MAQDKYLPSFILPGYRHIADQMSAEALSRKSFQLAKRRNGVTDEFDKAIYRHRIVAWRFALDELADQMNDLRLQRLYMREDRV